MIPYYSHMMMNHQSWLNHDDDFNHADDEIHILWIQLTDDLLNIHIMNSNNTPYQTEYYNDWPTSRHMDHCYKYTQLYHNLR